MLETPIPIDEVRRFNRFYTRQIGLLEKRYLRTPYSLTEARVIYELVTREGVTASELAAELGLDHGYLSRILRAFGGHGLLARTTSPTDRRRVFLSLTEKGRKAFGPLNERSQNEVAAMLKKLDVAGQERVVAAMRTIETAFGQHASTDMPLILRMPRPGDLGWIVSRHGALYAREYGWDKRIEALTAEIIAAFVRKHDRKRERCWIAEHDNENVGSVMLVKESKDAARLRLLLVEPRARGLGIGTRLVSEALRFARDARYREVTLWTHSLLTAARRIYEQTGFKLVGTSKHNEFGKTLIGETWQLTL